MTTIGDRIKYFRKMRGLTQKQLGDLLGVSAAAISQFESKKSPLDFKTQTVEKLCNALGIMDTNALLFDSNDEDVDYFVRWLLRNDVDFMDEVINGVPYKLINVDNSTVYAITEEQWETLPSLSAELIKTIIRVWSYNNSDPDKNPE